MRSCFKVNLTDENRSTAIKHKVTNTYLKKLPIKKNLKFEEF